MSWKLLGCFFFNKICFCKRRKENVMECQIPAVHLLCKNMNNAFLTWIHVQRFKCSVEQVPQSAVPNQQQVDDNMSSVQKELRWERKKMAHLRIQ